jgi:hypothetical protein
MKLHLKDWHKVLLIYFTTFIFFSVIYLLLFHTKLFFYQKVLFYRGIYFLVFTTLLFLILDLLSYFLLFKKHLDSLIAATLIIASIHLSIFVVFPVTFERSVTMFLLNTLSNASSATCKGLSKEEMQSKLINNYVIKNKAINKRVNEQQIIGFLSGSKDCIQLTPKSRQFLDMSKIIKRIYAIN